MNETIHSICAGYDKNFTYIVHNATHAILIDPSVAYQKVAKYLQEHKITLIAVILMHSHGDHIVDLKEYQNKKIPLYAHESFPIKNTISFAKRKKLQFSEFPNTEIELFHTPGHRFDCICLLLNKKHLFTSDTLFVRGCGRIDFPGSEPEKMIKTIEWIKTLADDITIYPGHDYGPTKISTIGEEKKLNPFLQMSQEEFLEHRLGK